MCCAYGMATSAVCVSFHSGLAHGICRNEEPTDNITMNPRHQCTNQSTQVGGIWRDNTGYVANRITSLGADRFQGGSFLFARSQVGRGVLPIVDLGSVYIMIPKKRQNLQGKTTSCLRLFSARVRELAWIVVSDSKCVHGTPKKAWFLLGLCIS